MTPSEKTARYIYLREKVGKAWQGVTHNGGTSYFDSLVRDAYGDVALIEHLYPTLSRRHGTIFEADDDPEWRVSPGFGGFTFMDAVGYRFFIGASLLRLLRSEGMDDEDDLMRFRKEEGQFATVATTQRSLLTEEQRQVIVEVLNYVADCWIDAGIDPRGESWFPTPAWLQANS